MLTINSMDFTPTEGAPYPWDYREILEDIEAGRAHKMAAFRTLMINDLFFLLYFVMGYREAHHPWVIAACNMVRNGPDDYTLDLWARGHFKSSIITKGETVQRILANPEERICIFSHTRPAAKSFLREIKQVFEYNNFMRDCFPDILWKDPERESPKWSEDDGLIVKRKGTYAESTLEASGLLEGTPVGKHFTRLVYDDVETKDVVNNPETLRRLKEAFNLSGYLKSRDVKRRVVGTTYHYEGLLTELRNKVDADNKPLYHVRVLPATDNGESNGEPVLWSKKELELAKLNSYEFNCQMLLNPTPEGARRLDSRMLKDIDIIPKDCYKFICVDPAGEAMHKRNSDSWAILLFGVRPFTDDRGASDVYLLDAVIEKMEHNEAIDQICQMYVKGGHVHKIAVEKTSQTAVEVHVARVLKEKYGRFLTVETAGNEYGGIKIVRPQLRNKEQRICDALQWPLVNGKLWMSNAVPVGYRERVRTEMDRFPYWHDDALDAWAYLYDVLKEFVFPSQGFSLSKFKQAEVGVV